LPGHLVRPQRGSPVILLPGAEARLKRHWNGILSQGRWLARGTGLMIGWPGLADAVQEHDQDRAKRVQDQQHRDGLEIAAARLEAGKQCIVGDKLSRGAGAQDGPGDDDPPGRRAGAPGQ
jgi:hypothetical protein